MVISGWSYKRYCYRPADDTVTSPLVGSRRPTSKSRGYIRQRDRVEVQNGLNEGWTHLLATDTILPLLIPEDGLTTLLGSDTRLLLQGLAQSASSDLGVLVVPISETQQLGWMIFGT